MGKRARAGSANILGQVSGAEFLDAGRLSGIYSSRIVEASGANIQASGSTPPDFPGSFRTSYSKVFGIANRAARDLASSTLRLSSVRFGRHKHGDRQPGRCTHCACLRAWIDQQGARYSILR